MNQLLTGDVWSQVNPIIKGKGQRTASIAYITSTSLNLRSGDILICDASDAAIRNGETSAKALQHYFSKGVKLYSNNQLHAKLLLTNSHLVTGSANLSSHSANHLIEAAIVTTDAILLSQARAFLFRLVNHRNTVEITKKELQRISSIEVIRRFTKPITGRKIKNETFGRNTWFITTYEIKPRSYEKIKEKVENTTEKLAKAKSVDQDNIGFIKWRANTEFAKNVKPGDQVIIKGHNASKTRCYISPPSTVLKTEIVNGFNYIYHDDSNADKAITATKFQQSIKGLTLRKPISTRTKVLDPEDLSILQTIWK